MRVTPERCSSHKGQRFGPLPWCASILDRFFAIPQCAESLNDTQCPTELAMSHPACTPQQLGEIGQGEAPYHLAYYITAPLISRMLMDPASLRISVAISHA